jgi:hypothetical protein
MKNRIHLISVCLSVIFSLDLSADDWYQAPPLLSPRGGAAAISYSSYIYVFGGKTINNKVLASVERYDIRTGIWDTTSVPAFQYPRYNASVVLFENKIYLMGGRDNNNRYKEVEVYDPAQNNWNTAHDLRKEREGLAGAVFNDRIYAIGGQEDNYKLISEIEWYDQPGDDWLEAVFSLPYPRAAHFSSVDKNTFYMFGGFYYGPTAESYKAEPGTTGYQWIRLGDLDRGRAYGASVKVWNEIFLIGGETSEGKTSAVEVFNMKTETFGPCVPISSARSGLAAATVQDTIIFIIGGFETDLDEPVTTVEYYYGELISSVEAVPMNQPGKFVLIKGYPNPFNNAINLEVSIPMADEYELSIFNITGQKILTVFKGKLPGGTSNFRWQASEEISSGLYIFSVHSQNYYQNYKLAYIK